MVRKFAEAGKWTKLGLGGVALMAAAIPAAGAFANAIDPTAKLTAAEVEQGRALFNDWSCSACHTLGDAKASGQIGPAFDGNAKLDYALVTDRVTNGQGAMPSFGGQMSDEEIDIIAKYVVMAKK